MLYDPWFVFSVWTPIIWGVFNIIIFGVTLCCFPVKKIGFCSILKISVLSIDRALNLIFLRLLNRVRKLMSTLMST